MGAPFPLRQLHFTASPDSWQPAPTHPPTRAHTHACTHANPDHPAQLLKPQLLLHRAPLPAARSQHTGMGSAPTTGTNPTAAPSSPAYPAASASPGTSSAGHSMDGGPGGMDGMNGMGGGRGFAKPIDPTYTARTFSQWLNGLDEYDPMILVCFMAAVASGAGCCSRQRCRLPSAKPPPAHGVRMRDSAAACGAAAPRAGAAALLAACCLHIPFQAADSDSASLALQCPALCS